MILYIAGPMTGYPRYNYDAFHTAEQQLADVGHRVLNPAGIGVDDEATGWTHPREWYLRRALRMLLEAEGVALLPGWTRSAGAQLEVNIAAALGMYYLPLDEWLKVDHGWTGRPVAADSRRAR